MNQDRRGRGRGTEGAGVKWTTKIHVPCHMPAVHPAESQMSWPCQCYRCRNVSKACAFNLASESLNHIWEDRHMHLCFKFAQRQDNVSIWSGTCIQQQTKLKRSVLQAIHANQGWVATKTAAMCDSWHCLLICSRGGKSLSFRAQCFPIIFDQVVAPNKVIYNQIFFFLNYISSYFALSQQLQL